MIGEARVRSALRRLGPRPDPAPARTAAPTVRARGARQEVALPATVLWVHARDVRDGDAVLARTGWTRVERSEHVGHAWHLTLAGTVTMLLHPDAPVALRR